MSSIPDRHPDAILAPRPFRRMRDPHNLFGQAFRPILGTRQIYTAPCGDQYFIRGDPESTLHFPTHHPLGSAERYEWYVVADNDTDQIGKFEKVDSWKEAPKAVKFGYLRPVEQVEPPSVEYKLDFLRKNQPTVEQVKEAMGGAAAPH
jgi:hypothetical protein